MPDFDTRGNTPIAERITKAGKVQRGNVGFSAGGGGPTPDTTEPTVTVISPAAGTPITPSTPLVVDVEDEDTIAVVRMFATFTGGGGEPVYDGDDFLDPYAGGGSTPTSTVQELVAGRHYRFTLRRVGGWPRGVSLNVLPVDGGGNFPTA